MVLEAVMRQDVDSLSITGKSKEKLKEIISETYLEEFNTEKYFKLKLLLMNSKYCFTNNENAIVSFASLPEYFKGFLPIIDSVNKVLYLLLKSGIYKEVEKAVWKKFEEDLRFECLCVESVLKSENIVSIRFRKSTTLLEIQQTKEFILNEFFLSFAKPIFE
jgi:hypothetical protein